MGTQGMKASLVSREVIADSIELTVRGYQFDALVALCACDKTIPGSVMALARLDIPSVLLYGGSILPGRYQGQDVTIQDVFEAIGAHAKGDMTDEELTALEDVASPGPGACGGQFTANTMACAYRGDGHRADGVGHGPRRRRGAQDGRRAGRRAGHEGARRGPAPEPDHHPRLDRERDRHRRDVGGLDQRRPAPAGAGARDGDRAHDRRLRPHLRAHPAARRPEAGRPLRRPRPERGRGSGPAGQAPRRGGDPQARRDHGHRPHDRRGGRRRDRGRGPGGRAPAQRSRSRRPGDW